TPEWLQPTLLVGRRYGDRPTISFSGLTRWGWRSLSPVLDFSQSLSLLLSSSAGPPPPEVGSRICSTSRLRWYGSERPTVTSLTSIRIGTITPVSLRSRR